MTQVESSEGTRTRQEVTVRKARKVDLVRVTNVMARAFDDDPIANWFAAQDDKRRERVHRFMNFGLRKLTFPHGEVYTTDAIEGAAAWTPPGKWKLDILQQLMMLPEMVKVTSWRRVPGVMRGLDAVEKKHPHEPHYYLLGLGVEPNLQGRGLGTKLMQPILERCDREKVPAYLESSKEKNVPLYERNGFKVTEKFQMPNGGPPLWLMWRDPQ
jgi:ribosomal protein S18 acetylase RimI-like enzyme